MRYLRYILLIAASLMLFACGNKSSSTGTGVINVNGGDGGSGAGGNGGTITPLFSNNTSMVHGDLKFHAGGTVNATFSVPAVGPDFGTNPAIIAASSIPTTVQSATSVASGSSLDIGTYFVVIGASDNNLYHVDAAGSASVITGLTVNAGATLKLPNVNVFTLIASGVVINGTVTNTTDGEALDLRSGSFMQVNGVVTTKPTPTGAGISSGPLNLSSGGMLINLGTIESSGSDGSGNPGGASGGVTLHAASSLYNTGIINAKGGGSTSGAGGAGGAIQLLADAASVSTSGAIDASGGNGVTGGTAGAITAFGGADASVIGRVTVAGSVTANGGSGSTGNGGDGAAISLTSFSGGILINAPISAVGGPSTTGGNGGNGGSLQLNNRVGSDNAAVHLVSPEGIKVAGNITLNGGKGAGLGGAGGALSFASEIAGSSLPGFASIEFFGYQAITLNGGASTSSTGGTGGTVTYVISSPTPIVAVDIPAGGVVNEVAITARGGDNNPTSATKNDGGGNGGIVQFASPQRLTETVDPARTIVTNSGGIDISGGSGTTGGAGGRMTVTGYGNVTNSGGITAIGGTGTTGPGGAGSASISLFSSSNVANSGSINASGGATTSGTGGAGGSVSLSSGSQTTTAAIAATGGNSASSTGGNGGSIILFSELVLTTRSSLNVAKGSGGSAQNGTIKIDGSFASIPSSGAI